MLVPGLPSGDPTLVAGGGGAGGPWVWFLVLSCCACLVALSPIPAVVSVVPALPLPFVCFFFLFFCAVLVVSASSWSLACLFPGGGVCRRVWGISSSGPSVAAWSWWAAFSGWASLGWARWSLRVLSVGPVGAAHGVAWLGGFPASMEWVPGYAVVWPSLLLSSGPLSWRVCARGVERATRWFSVRRWLGLRFEV